MTKKLICSFGKNILPENGCAELYDPISDKVCVRISSYQETYEAAQEKCKSEGSYLLYDINSIIHVISDSHKNQAYILHKTILGWT